MSRLVLATSYALGCGYGPAWRCPTALWDSRQSGDVLLTRSRSDSVDGFVQLPIAARIDSRNELRVASTAVGSYPQCAMQLAHRSSLPRPNWSQSVSSSSSLYVFAYPSASR